jgi:hypothetical protein
MSVLRKVYLLVFLTLSMSLTAQKNQGNAAVAGAAVAGALAIGAAAFEMHQIIEMWELTATEYVLETKPEATEFTLKLNRPFVGSIKWSDVSNISILSFNIKYSVFDEFKRAKREVLLMFMDDGYMTEYGINVTKITWKVINRDEWNNMLDAYVQLATGIDVIDFGQAYIHEPLKKKNFDKTNPNHIYTVNRDMDTNYFEKTKQFLSLANGISFNNGGLYDGSGFYKIAAFNRISGDAYLINDFSDQFKIVYNERSLGLFIKETNKLVQLRRSVLNEITSFINYH